MLFSYLYVINRIAAEDLSKPPYFGNTSRWIR